MPPLLTATGSTAATGGGAVSTATGGGASTAGSTQPGAAPAWAAAAVPAAAAAAEPAAQTALRDSWVPKTLRATRGSTTRGAADAAELITSIEAAANAEVYFITGPCRAMLFSFGTQLRFGG